MFRHNLLITIRNFKKNRNSFLINILGLSTGMACVILIYMWVSDELRHDKFHQHGDRLLQVMQNLNKNKDDILTWEWTPGILAKSLLEDIPEVEASTQVVGLENTGVISIEDTKYKAKEYFVGHSFFELFSFRLIEGRKTKVLNNLNSIAISDELAIKLFGTTQGLVGETIQWERNWENVSGDYQITGVFEKPSKHSSLQFDVLFSYDLFVANNPDILQWYNSDPYTYVLLKEGADFDQFNAKIENYLATKQESTESTLFARKYTDQYLFNNYENGVQSGGRIQYIKLFCLIALFVLVIACINFMNLSTARSSRRAKEIGVKKSIGASRRSLISQYLFESTIIVSIALFFAMFLILIGLEPFNEITGKQLSLQFNVELIIAVLGISLFTAFVAGSYPAFYLSGFRPINAMKDKMSKSIGALFVRKGLVVFQFALSILLIVAVTVIYKQLEFVHSQNLGYDRDNVLVIQKDGEIADSTITFLNALRNIPGVMNASTLDGDLTGGHGYTTTIRWKGNENPENPTRIGVMIVGNDMINTLGMQLISGRDFRKDVPFERDKAIVNEAAAKLFGFDNPVGEVLQHRRSEIEIIGVVKDFHYESMYNPVKPCVIKGGSYGEKIYARIQKNTEAETLASVEKLYGQFNPGIAFEFNFIDEDYQKLYASEKRVAVLSRYFAGLAILISCLGLFALAAFTAERREKEISVRKVLGAPISNIVFLLSKDFILLVVIAILIASPLAAYLMQSWLNNFAYNIDVSIWQFIFAGLTVLVLAFLTISFQSIKAAMANPIDSLRND